ncbi:hypothetical protein M5D10_07490 [Leptospira santarosai]|uniref:hypothetical protein n=1 Tax=Leptospira santarosai TaxID=28183 RepID=UPI0022A8D957|nr:hypothetical protein [Leptospira santarosai]UZN08765.1 hypothetical protein M5D10_07490 [Leptospira santarosai]
MASVNPLVHPKPDTKFCPKSDNEFAIFLAPIIPIKTHQVIKKQKDLKLGANSG